MGTVEAASIIVGIVMPLLVAVVHQAGWPRRANLAIALLSCAGAGVLTAWAAGQLSGQEVVVAVAIVFSAAQAAYQAYWRDSRLLGAIDERTTVVRPPE